MASNLQIIINGVDNASGAFDDVGGAMDSLTGKSKGLLSAGLGPLQSMLGGALKVSLAGAAAGVGALAAGLGSSISDAADFQQSMADIQASMGASAEDTSKLKNLIMDLGIDPKLKVSAEQAAQAIGQLGTAGVSIDDIMNGAARSTVLLANATGADFADAASIASDVSKLWSIDAGDLTHAVDGITAATVASKFNINDYKLALSQAGGVASTVGVSFDDFNATIAAISPSFASGSDAGTSLKVLLQRLVPSSDKAKDAMKDLGLMTALTGTRQQAYQKMLDEYKGKLAALGPKTKENAKDYKGLSDAVDNLTSIMQTGQNAFFDEKGNMKSMAEVAGILNKAFKGLSEEQKNQYLSTIFGTDAMRAAAALAKMTTGDFENLQTTMAKTDAAESAKTRMDTLRGSLEILSGTFGTLKLMVGDKFLPVLNDLVKRFNDFLGAQAPMIVEWAGKFADYLGNLITTYLPVFVAQLSAWWSVGQKVVGVVSSLAMALFDVLTGHGADSSWWNQLTYQLLPLFSSNIVDAYRKANEWAATLATVGGAISSLINWVKEAVSSLFSWASQYVTLNDVLTAAGVLLTAMILPSLAAFVAALTPVIAVVGGAIAIVTTLRTAWTQDWLNIREIVLGTLDYIQARFGPLLDAIRTFGGGALQEIGNWVTGTQTQFTNLSRIWDQVKLTAQALFNDLVSYIRSSLPGWIATLQNWGEAAWQWIKDATPTVLAKLGEWANALFQWVVGRLPAWLAQLQTWGNAAWGWIVDMTPIALAKLSAWGSALWGWVQSNWPTWKARLLDWGNAAWQWIQDVTPITLGKLSEWGSALWGWVQNNWPIWKTHLLDWGFAAWQWIQEMTPIAITKLGEWGTALFQWIGNNLPRWTQTFLGWATAAVQWLGDVVPLAIGKLNEWLDGMTRYSSGEGSGKMTIMTNQLGDAIKKTLGEIALAVAGLALNIGTNIVLNVAQGLLDDFGIKTNLFKIKDDIVKELTSWNDVFKSHGIDMSKGLSDGFSLFNPIGGAIKAVGAIVSGVKELLGIHSPSTVFADIGGAMIQGLIQGLGSIDIGGVISTLMTKLRDRYNYWHDDLVPHFFASAKDLANNLIGGLKKGIENGIGAVMSAIQGVTDALPQWVKDKLGIHSPSTVFAGLGQNIMQGLVEGMQSMAGAPQAVLSDMTAGMMLGANGGGSVVDNSQRNTSHTWNVTIPTAGGNQPVDQMQSMFNTLTTIYAG